MNARSCAASDARRPFAGAPLEHLKDHRQVVDSAPWPIGGEL